MEIWKKIKGFEMYEISNLGNVRNTITNKILTPCDNGKGYMRVNLNHKTKYIHRLVAEAFIPNPNNWPVINHKDENKKNNDISNLEWCTVSYNNNYGTKNQRCAEKLYIPVYQYDLNGNFIKRWDAASLVKDISKTSINNCLSGRSKTAGGYIWKYE